MISKLHPCSLLFASGIISLMVLLPACAQQNVDAQVSELPTDREDAAAAITGHVYYVRQTIGDDANDGLTPQTAWRTVGKLSSAMHAGDTAYVGPGLYRDKIVVLNDGSADAPITIIADNKGAVTGDPPGVVMITGADPVDEEIFSYDSAMGVYSASFPDERLRILGAVEMDGDQYRYYRATQTREFLAENMPAVAVVAKMAASYFYDEETKTLYIQTTDRKHPREHELEIIRRLNGISTTNKQYIRIIGFTFRHEGDAGINFFQGSSHCTAINNTSYGCRQGIRVRGATNIALYGNTCFRNENSGIYAFFGSLNFVGIGNIAYENAKGIRLGSWSLNSMVLDNVLFENRECGLSVEEADRSLLRGNRLVGNIQTQLSVLRCGYTSDHNCFERTDSTQSTTDFAYPFPSVLRIATLAEYQENHQQDLSSTEGSCGPLPEKLDVQQLHAETTAYTERARRILEQAAADQAGSTGKNTSP